MSINTECPICFADGSIIPLSIINCQKLHTFHKPCLIQWLKRSSPYQTFQQKWNQRIQNIWEDTRFLGRSLPFADSFPVRQIKERILRPASLLLQLPPVLYHAAKDSDSRTATCMLCQNTFSQIDGEPLPLFKPISKKDFLENVRNGKLPALQMALDNQPLTDTILEEAVSLAIELNQPAVISLFSQNCLIEGDIQALALIKASSRGSKGMVQALLANGPISEEHRGIAVGNAAHSGHIGIIQTLLANNPISEEHRGQAVICATSEGYTGVVEALLDNGSISEEHRGIAIGCASRLGHGEIFQALLDNGSISEEHRGTAISCASHEGYRGIVEALLDNGPISQEHRGWAVGNAAYNGHQEIVQILLASGPISEKHRGIAFYFANRRSATKISQILLENGLIPIKYKLILHFDNAIDIARNQCHRLVDIGMVAWVANRYFSEETNSEQNYNL